MHDRLHDAFYFAAKHYMRSFMYKLSNLTKVFEYTRNSYSGLLSLKVLGFNNQNVSVYLFYLFMEAVLDGMLRYFNMIK